MEASVRKSHLDFSLDPGLSVLIATSISCMKFGGTFKRPRQTSPNSPPPGKYFCLNILKVAQATLTDYCFYRDVAGVNFSRELADRLVGVFVVVWIDVSRAVGTEERRRHCKIVATSRIIFIATFYSLHRRERQRRGMSRTPQKYRKCHTKSNDKKKPFQVERTAGRQAVSIRCRRRDRVATNKMPHHTIIFFFVCFCFRSASDFSNLFCVPIKVFFFSFRFQACNKRKKSSRKN